MCVTRLYLSTIGDQLVENIFGNSHVELLHALVKIIPADYASEMRHTDRVNRGEEMDGGENMHTQA